MLLKTDYIQNIKIVGKNEISGLLLPHISSQNTNQLAVCVNLRSPLPLL